MALFGNASTANNTQTTNPFGIPAASIPVLFPNPPAGSTSLFGASANAQPIQQQTRTLFGQPSQQPQAGSSFFGGNAATTNLFQTPQQQQPATTSMFGTTGGTQNQQPSTTGLFGAPSNVQNQQAQQFQQQQPQQQPQQIGSILGYSLGNKVWNEQDMQPRQKSVQDQIQILARKWEPNDPTTSFKAYLYNTVPKDSRPFFSPGPQDDEEKWEDALRKAPNDSAVPVLVTGFQQLGSRMVLQSQTLAVLQGRLHEINNGLTELLRRHDLEISARAAECRRRHIRLSQKCLALATKTQILKNRGYTMDAAEEQLRAKLVDLEKAALDPALHGRSEEMWARMVTIRDRGLALNAELERQGQAAKSAGVNADASAMLDEAMVKKVKQILEEYDSQIEHLNKELEQVQLEFQEWQSGK
ncbi:MAG: hypothetical protein GOMPHAMPRED_008068 [Gomphillus americanus]|uniref:Nucleoporin Nup54 alpha-helical domain-containing protein n=1 Tax=Gomphillus americanus TaxID=1940652 RepID=A0A8H3IAV9_9LECA|nr:MAG: hypothetical protein GOMPHAMPRED_008068 [Gomphillus americanus]